MRTIIRDNATLEWEQLIPMLMLAYNCHVHRSTRETPFFLTFLHDPRLPVFDVSKPRQFYNHGFVEDNFVMMRAAFQSAQLSMEEAKKKSKTYYDKTAVARTFKQGDRVLCYFPNSPPGQNRKFYTLWQEYVVIKPVGNLNVLIQKPVEKAKPILVHVDRVIHLHGGQPHPCLLYTSDAADE